MTAMPDHDPPAHPSAATAGFFRRQCRRYLDLQVGDAFGVTRRNIVWLDRLIEELTESRSDRPSAPNPPTTWEEAVHRYGYSVPRLRKNYEPMVLVHRLNSAMESRTNPSSSAVNPCH